VTTAKRRLVRKSKPFLYAIAQSPFRRGLLRSGLSRRANQTFGQCCLGSVGYLVARFTRGILMSASNRELLSAMLVGAALARRGEFDEALSLIDSNREPPALRPAYKILKDELPRSVGNVRSAKSALGLEQDDSQGFLESALRSLQRRVLSETIDRRATSQKMARSLLDGELAAEIAEELVELQDRLNVLLPGSGPSASVPATDCETSPFPG